MPIEMIIHGTLSCVIGVTLACLITYPVNKKQCLLIKST